MRQSAAFDRAQGVAQEADRKNSDSKAGNSHQAGTAPQSRPVRGGRQPGVFARQQERKSGLFVGGAGPAMTAVALP